MITGEASSPNDTVLDGEGKGSTISISSGEVSLDDLKITGGSGTATLCPGASSTSCLFGGGVFVKSGNVLLRDSSIVGNVVRASYLAYGGGIFIGDGSLSLDNSFVESN